MFKDFFSLQGNFYFTPPAEKVLGRFHKWCNKFSLSPYHYIYIHSFFNQKNLFMKSAHQKCIVKERPLRPCLKHFIMETLMKCFGQKSDCFHFPGDYQIAGHMKFVKAFRVNFMINFFYRVLHVRLLFPEI